MGKSYATCIVIYQNGQKRGDGLHPPPPPPFFADFGLPTANDEIGGGWVPPGFDPPPGGGGGGPGGVKFGGFAKSVNFGGSILGCILSSFFCHYFLLIIFY